MDIESSGRLFPAVFSELKTIPLYSRRRCQSSQPPGAFEAGHAQDVVCDGEQKLGSGMCCLTIADYCVKCKHERKLV